MIYKSVNIDIRIKAIKYKLPNRFEILEISQKHNIAITSGVLDPEKKSIFYPSRSDEKIMRTDVVSAIIGILEMLEELQINDNERERMALFVANSIFIEENNKNLKRALSVLNKLNDFSTQEQRIHAIYKNTPPLLALETLTNATMSFISKYTGIKGGNTTFGSTSHSAYEALEESVYQLESKQVNNVLVGGSNCSGLYSFLTFSNFYKNTADWKESACASFLVLGNEGNVKISMLRHNFAIPSLEVKSTLRTWKNFFNDISPSFIVYSGGFTASVFKENEKEVKAICPNYFSWEKEYGNLGATAIFMNLAYAHEIIKEGITNIVDVLNRDVYGRETHIRIEKATK